MYVFISFLVIKSDVFVSALKIDGYNKNKMLKIHNKKLISQAYIVRSKTELSGVNPMLRHFI